VENEALFGGKEERKEREREKSSKLVGNPPYKTKVRI
jgi:hypothetical protein